MGVEALLIGGAILVGGLLAAYFYTQSQDVKGQDMKPATLDSFSVTYCEEGSVVPLIYGKVRVPGNIMWYGNLDTTVSHANGPGRPIDGYYYRLDVWQAIGQGLLEILGLYSADKAATPTNSYTYTPSASGTSGEGITRTFQTPEGVQTIIYNPGDSQYYPTSPGENANAMHPVCHAFIDGWLMPKNATYFPTIHWVVRHHFPHWFPLANSAVYYNGITYVGDNPAAIIYDILLKAGETSFNLSSFQTAATTWYNKGYGLNISFNQQSEVKELLQTVFNYVDGVLTQNANGEWELTAFTDTDAAVATIDTDDLVEFSFTRDSWDSVPNYFVANYQDAAADYSRRTVRFSNSASIAMLGYRRTKTIDLTAFSDATIASSRLWELGKRLSFPPLRVQFKTDLRFHALEVGQVASITNTDFGLSAAEFRVTAKSIEDLDKNLISFEGEQLWSTLFDSSFQVGGETEQEVPDYSPAPLVYQAVFELPFMEAYGSYPPAFILLAARNGTEAAFNVYISYDGVGYSFVKTATLWSLTGILNHDYDSSHTTQGDPTAIDLKFFREDPVFSSLSAAAFPYTDRFALIGNEILRFQTVAPGLADDDLLLTTIERGCFNTPVENHTQDDRVWLFNLGDGMVLEGITATSFFLKFVPLLGVAADISECLPIAMTPTQKAYGHSESPSVSPSASASA